MSKTATVVIEKLIPGGQGMARLEDGRVIFVWGALPGEEVEVFITKKKKRHAQGVIDKVIKASKHRIEPKDEAYLSTSPWQTMEWSYENEQKAELIKDSFAQTNVDLPDFSVYTDDNQWNYRNKVEFSFWWVEETDKIELSFFRRGSSSKVIVDGTSLASTPINEAAKHLVAEINRVGIQARQLKTLLLRSNKEGQVVAALFSKDEDIPFGDIELGPVKGIEIWHSNPDSPASVRTQMLYRIGEVELKDTIAGKDFVYDVHSFFQVNLPLYEQTLADIKEFVNGQPVLDMYCGVGSIGLNVSPSPTLVEIDENSATFAEFNAPMNVPIHLMKAEDAVDLIEQDKVLILDPPRAGLHKKVIKRITHVMPPSIVYLSCDAGTHARDIALLLEAGYKISSFKAYNFFPRTPHTETLALLTLK